MKVKLLLFAAICCVPFPGFSQDITSYKASNGVTYHLNDTVRLGKGSNFNGAFLYIEERGPMLPVPPGQSTPSGHNLPKEYANAGVIVKAIRVVQVKGTDKYVFMVNTGSLFRFALFIDDAIAACEVKPCSDNKASQPTFVADEILKLKKLLDSGAITQAEYDAQKKKLLGD